MMLMWQTTPGLTFSFFFRGELTMAVRSIWGWGYGEEQVKHKDNIGILGQFLPCDPSSSLSPVDSSDVALRPPRFQVHTCPDNIKAILTDDKIQRMRHSYGKVLSLI